MHQLSKLKVAPWTRLIWWEKRVRDDRQHGDGVVLHDSPQNVSKRMRRSEMVVRRGVIRPLVGCRKVPSAVQPALDELEGKIRQALVFRSLHWPVRPFRLDDSRRQRRGAFFR